MASRAIETSDAASVAALIRAVFGAIPEPLDPQPSALRETEASVLAHLAAGGGGAVITRAELVAAVLWSERDGGLYLGRLATAPRCRGQGLATGLVHAAEAEARRRGLPRLHLGVRLALPGNRRLFARLGFTETARHAHPGHSEPTWTEAEKWLVTAPPPRTGTPPGSPGAPPLAAPSSARSRASGR
jgi:predicted N-acetyltransferase YhbS